MQALQRRGLRRGAAVGIGFALAAALLIGFAYLLVPAILILLTCFSFGLGLLVALLNVRYRDINYLVGIGLQVLFYATPIVYRVDTIGHHPLLGIDPKHVLDLNPMSIYISGIRAALPRKNASRHGPYAGYYDDWSRGFVAARYREDIEQFGYSFEALS